VRAGCADRAARGSSALGAVRRDGERVGRPHSGGLFGALAGVASSVLGAWVARPGYELVAGPGDRAGMTEREGREVRRGVPSAWV
jgi:hypothetical protein